MSTILQHTFFVHWKWKVQVSKGINFAMINVLKSEFQFKKNNRHIQQWLIALLEYRESNCLCVKYEMDKTVVLTQWCLTGLWSILNARNTYVCWWQPTELDEIGIPVLTYTCPPISQGATFDGYLINHTL